jgi:capsule polysaccharide modification protein KpsS
MLARYAGKRILMLQGPNGWFFRRVAKRLVGLGATVTKVNFNPADSFFFPGPNVVTYREGLDAWPETFERLLRERHIDVVLLFGDCRPYHRAAMDRAEILGIEVAVFEEGYLRPNYVTLEVGGVNGKSKLPRDPEFYRDVALEPSLPKAHPVGNVMPEATFVTILNSLACTLFGFRYPKYQHHRDVNTWRQCALWARGFYRKQRYKRRDRAISKQIVEQRMEPYFVVALQVHLDSQMNYCKYGDIEEFITEVVESFAQHAPKDNRLLVKHHPFDRPYRDYTDLIDELRRRFALGDRLVYVDVIPLPAALKHARGTIVINSTVGLSSVQFGTPTKCLGDAVYDISGLTHQGSLADFWQNPGSVDRELYARFRHYLRTTTQLNGSVWTDLFDGS